MTRSMVRLTLCILGLLVALSLITTTVSDRSRSSRMEPNREALRKWREMRFGMFIHWGPVSLKGTEIGWSRGREVPRKEYDSLYKQFNPTAFSAAEWVALARQAGMKYMVFTAKHHDGFCLWDSKYTDYDIMATPFGRDVTRELSDECKRRGIMFCTYYSILDWHHPDYLPHSHGGPGFDRGRWPVFERYVTHMKNQLRELVTQYGPLGVLWFDGYWERTWSYERGRELYAYCRKLQDEMLINNRVGKRRRVGRGRGAKNWEYVGDYGTPEQDIGAFDRASPWETCMTLCRQWAWKPEDEMKSLRECLQTLVSVVGSDGNFLLSVGPMPDGRIEPRQAERLRQMGAWLGQYGRSVYGTRGGPFKPGDWGAATCKGRAIYLHVLRWPKEGKLLLPPIEAKVLRSAVLTGGGAAVRQTPRAIEVAVPEKDRQAIDTIVVLELDRPAFDVPPVDVKAREPAEGKEGEQ